MLAFIASPLGRLLAAGLLLIAAYLGLQWWGTSKYAAGVAAEKVRWETAAAVERARQDAVSAAVEATIDRVDGVVRARVEALRPLLQSIKDEASNEDAAPLSPPAAGCPLDYRGLAPDSLRKLDALR